MNAAGFESAASFVSLFCLGREHEPTVRSAMARIELENPHDFPRILARARTLRSLRRPTAEQERKIWRIA